MKKILFTILSAVALVSCVDMLQLSPTDKMASSKMWTTEELADKGMAGLYRNFYKEDLSHIQLRHNDMTGINRQGIAGLEFAVDYQVDNYPLAVLSEDTKKATEFLIWYEWKWAYTSIHQINDAIFNLSKSPLSKEKADRYLCEAKFLRAWFYARLNQLYGGVPMSDNPNRKGGVPVYLTPVSDVECNKTQTPAADVWGIIIDDLTYCIESEYFPLNTLTQNYGSPSKGAAYSLRGLAYTYLEEWEKAAQDFEEVAKCGYGLWDGEYGEFFHYKNEKHKEMIFPLQFSSTSGYCDNLQLMLGGRDTWDSWSNIRPSSDFVDYYQNADGSKFEWTQVIPEWNDPIFQSNPEKREVFFLRDSLITGLKGPLGTGTDDNMNKKIKEVINRIGEDIIDDYYMDLGNEARVLSAFENRDPRLKQTILVPYERIDTYRGATFNGGEAMKGKRMTLPYLFESPVDYGDYYVSAALPTMYLFKKYVYFKKEDLEDRLRCPTDWPLIRYTDVYLRLAEAYANCDRLGDAMDIVNEIRTRAGFATTLPTGSYEEVMEAIRYERRVELCMEGHTYFDEWRWETYKDMKFQGNNIYGGQNWWGDHRNFSYNWYYKDNMYPWAAPAGECQRNTSLERKAGWAY